MTDVGPSLIATEPSVRPRLSPAIRDQLVG
jgi:hypothetical protein